MDIYGENILCMTKIADKWPENSSLQMATTAKPFELET